MMDALATMPELAQGKSRWMVFRTSTRVPDEDAGPRPCEHAYKVRWMGVDRWFIDLDMAALRDLCELTERGLVIEATVHVPDGSGHIQTVGYPNIEIYDGWRE
jgi:hypothetical protein